MAIYQREAAEVIRSNHDVVELDTERTDFVSSCLRTAIDVMHRYREENGESLYSIANIAINPRPGEVGVFNTIQVFVTKNNLFPDEVIMYPILNAITISDDAIDVLSERQLTGIFIHEIRHAHRVAQQAATTAVVNIDRTLEQAESLPGFIQKIASPILDNLVERSRNQATFRELDSDTAVYKTGYLEDIISGLIILKAMAYQHSFDIPDDLDLMAPEQVIEQLDRPTGGLEQRLVEGLHKRADQLGVTLMLTEDSQGWRRHLAKQPKEEQYSIQGRSNFWARLEKEREEAGQLDSPNL
jgi:hypothetical protein